MPIAHTVTALLLALGAPGAAGKRCPPPEWISASGAESGSERTGPEAAAAWARLLAGEGSYAAASRAYENLVRRWPGAPGAERALLEAARAALAAGQFDRTARLVAELRARWPEGETAAERDRTELSAAEVRLAASADPALSAGAAQKHAKSAYRAFGAILKRDRAGEIAERAALGRARTVYRLGKAARAAKMLKEFLQVFPRSKLIPEVRRELADIEARRARHRSVEPQVLDRARERVERAMEQAAADGGEPHQAIRETYRAIAARQAELKMEEAELYIRLKKPRAAETVLRSVLRRYGDTPAAKRAAELLEELSGK